MSANDTAVAILLIIKTLSKWILFLALGLLAIGLTGAGAFWVYNEITFERPKRQILVAIKYAGGKECSTPSPWLVRIENKSLKTIKETTVYIEARHHDRSTNIAYAFENFSTDLYIRPDEIVIGCTSIRAAKLDGNLLTDSKLDVSVSSYRPVFAD